MIEKNICFYLLSIFNSIEENKLKTIYFYYIDTCSIDYENTSCNYTLNSHTIEWFGNWNTK